MNQAKQHHTWATGSTASDTTTGTPLQQGDALVAYENVRREKNSEGKENGRGIKCDINVRRAWCNGILWICRVSETRTSCPHWHRTPTGDCDGSEGGADFAMV
jgi:hypothetical protein